jgi:hypothetical protein
MAVHPIHPPAADLAPRPAAARRQGVCIVELRLALGILAIIGGTLATMLFATSRGSRSGADLRRRNLKVEVVSARIDSAVRSSCRILAAGNSFLVLWLGESRQNSVPDLSEICRIEWNAGSKQLRYWSAKPGLTDAENTAYTFTTDFATTTAALASDARFPMQVWGRNLAGWSLTLDNPTPSLVKVVQYSLQVEDDEGVATYQNAVSRRGQ